MKLLKQFAIIMSFWFAGELINRFFKIPVPGGVIGLLLLLIALNTKLVAEESIKELSDFFLKNLAFFFVPAGVSLLGYYHLIKGKMLAILLLLLVTNVLVMVVTGWVVQILLRLKGRSENGNI